MSLSQKSVDYFNFTEKKHSDHSASGSHRWLNCSASVEFTRGIPKRDSIYSFEGTVAHELAKCALETGVCPTKIRINKYTKDKKIISLVTDEMRGHVKDFIAYVKKTAPFDAQILVEHKVNLDWIAKDMSGTLDVAIIETWGDIHVIDFKYGAGVEVEASGNSQMIFYGLGLAGAPSNWDFGLLHTHVFQPRRDNISKATLSRKELVKWVETFKKGHAATIKKGASFKSGDWCRFCEGKASCPEIKKEVQTQMQSDFDDTKSLPVRVTDLTPLQISRVLDKAKMIRDWLTTIESVALHQLESGGKIPHYKLVDKRGRRKWVDESLLAKKLKAKKELFTEPELKSPAQVEKIMGKGFVDKFVVYESSGKTIAREGDERIKTVSKIQEDFDD